MKRERIDRYGFFEKREDTAVMTMEMDGRRVKVRPTKQATWRGTRVTGAREHDAVIASSVRRGRGCYVLVMGEGEGAE